MMPLPLKRVRIKERTPRDALPKRPLLFPGIINERTILCVTSSVQTSAQRFYDDRIWPLSCANEENITEIRDAIKLFRRLLLRVTSQLKPGDPILPDPSGPDSRYRSDIPIYLPISPCDLKPVQDELGYVKLKMKRPSADNDTDVERTDYFRADLSSDSLYVNSHLICQKLLRAFENGLNRKKAKRKRKRKSRTSRTSSASSETQSTVSDVTSGSTTSGGKTEAEMSAMINGVLGARVQYKVAPTIEPIPEENPNMMDENMDNTKPNITITISDESKTEELDKQSPSEQDNPESLKINIDDDDSKLDFLNDDLMDVVSMVTNDDVSLISDVEGPGDFSDLDQLSLSTHGPTNYPIVQYNLIRLHIIPVIILRKMDCDFYQATPYCHDRMSESPIHWRKSYIYKERCIFRSMQLADGGSRLKVYQLLINLVKVDKALKLMNDDVIMAAMLHDFDMRIDATPRWQRNNLETSLVSVLQTLNDLLVENRVPHFFMKQFDLLEGVPLLQIARLKARVRSLASSPAILDRAFKLQPIEMTQSAAF